ncbi:hypothetical protein B1C78_13170 [Thioalkalivibrio denitrificans]|uniref:Uncharacterized protein n=1 Tax=Thioalkalivibrio denitrificans TaxID=108003 RepID=A0A1V3ND07_9GAMM|nr:hypothetical protein B1C78_13170 [Thioalkalivibrio denitrificans]
MPLYLAMLVPDREVISLRFMEVTKERKSAADYLENHEQAHHVLWFTRRTSPDDPCEAFRRQLEGMGKRGNE